MTPHDAKKYLPAFADGELDIEQNLRVLEQMAMDPSHTKRVMHQQQLRRACAKVMCSPDTCCPDELKARLAGLSQRVRSDAEAMDRGDGGRPSVLARLGRWLGPAALAAAVFAAIYVGLNIAAPPAVVPAPAATTNATATMGLAAYTPDGLIPAALARTFAARHIECGEQRVPPHQSELFPTSLDTLHGVLAQRLGPQLGAASLDLTSLGYDYQIAGVCPIPGGESVHLIYRNPRGEALSLWIKPYDGKPTLDPGVPYIPPLEHAGLPMIVWREGDTVFYLVGDDAPTVRQAQPLVHLARA